MRISDWSSDVCSSDLGIWVIPWPRGPGGEAWAASILTLYPLESNGDHPVDSDERPRRRSTMDARHAASKIGRASCRESVCQYVSITVVAVSLKKNTNKPQAQRQRRNNIHHKQT